MKPILASKLAARALPCLLAFLGAQSVQFATDHTNALYRCGETARFTLRVVDSNKAPLASGQLAVRLDNFGPRIVTNAVFDLAAGNPVEISGTLAEPGFLKCTATIKLEKTVRAVHGVGYEPQRIRAGSPRPADFDAFWDAAVAKLDATVPADARLERLDAKSDANRDCFRVSYATAGGLRVWGFLAIPRRGAGPFPVEVNVPGAGPGVVGPNTGLADRGIIALTMNVHPFEPAPDAAAQKKLYDEQDAAVKARYGAQRYCHAGATNRETYFYYPIILGINRAVNQLAERPEVDKARFTYGGTSQGGGFGLILCGLNKRFTKGSIHVPAITDLLGFRAGRDSGWPKLLESLPAGDKEAAERVAPYFDGAHFAARIHCPVRFSVGFIDETCSPAAVYAGYNALAAADKAILHGIGMPHSVFPLFYELHDNQWLRGFPPPAPKP
ncbi:MAG: acetylxylan esterase [Spirochaetes bacterium]|nr:acetylxylan esterase [Spirochaetota bacterium]